jgi:Asp-tRNA(Asn)/Glu-tRNA(Gln) amidotransferase A subunit family amidase
MLKSVLLNTLSMTEIAAGVQRGLFSCEEVAQACLRRIEKREANVKAWSFIDPVLVMRNAKALDAQQERGPLHGAPIGVKDVLDTYDMPTEMGSPIYKGRRTPSDASCVAQLRSAGALILGKTVTCEFAGTAAGPTTNPHDFSRTPGGSSSGSAAAVADMMAPLALGTQTGGSVQRPSSYCGVVGFKPTFGFINTEGLRSAAESLDTIGLMARTVDDIELAARVLTNSEPAALLESNTRFNVGVCRTYAWNTAESATQEAIEDTAKQLLKSGFKVQEVELASPFSDLPYTREIINDYERARGMAFEWNTHREKISARLANTIRNGFTITRERYTEALQRLQTCRQILDDHFANIDVLLTPTAAGEAPLGLDYTGDHRFQSIWTQLRTPTVTLPTHAGPNGMPVGIQLVGPAFSDNKLIAISRLIFDILGRGPIVAD